MTRDNVEVTTFGRVRFKEPLGTEAFAPASITPAQLAPGLITYVDIRLTDAQIKALGASPVAAIPNPGAGLAVVPLFATARSVIVTPYTPPVDDPVGVVLCYSSQLPDPGGNNAVLLFRLNQFGFYATAGTYRRFSSKDGPLNYSGNYVDLVANSAVVISQLSTTGEFTGGHADNVVDVRIYYMVVPV